MSAQRTVNARKLAANRSKLQGSVKIQALIDVHDRLADTNGELKYQLAFRLANCGSDALPAVAVELQAEVNLLCQRSLTPFVHIVESSSQVVLVTEQTQVTELAEDHEPFVCSDIELNINALLTEELLLALPLVAINSGAEGLSLVGNEQNQVEQQDDHPFAGLAALKKD